MTAYINPLSVIPSQLSHEVWSAIYDHMRVLNGILALELPTNTVTARVECEPCPTLRLSSKDRSMGLEYSDNGDSLEVHVTYNAPASLEASGPMSFTIQAANVMAVKLTMLHLVCGDGFLINSKTCEQPWP